MSLLYILQIYNPVERKQAFAKWKWKKEKGEKNEKRKLYAPCKDMARVRYFWMYIFFYYEYIHLCVLHSTFYQL